MSIKPYFENGKQYFYKEYNLYGDIFSLSAETIENNPEIVRSEIFRESLNDTSSGFNMMVGCDKTEFFEEMDFLINQLVGKELNQQSCWDAYSNLCGEHVNQHRRIIDNDIESYLDRIFYLMQSISLYRDMKPMTDEQGIMLRKSFRQSSYKYFKDYIYVTIKDSLSMNPLSQFKLVKYADTLK